MELQVLSPHPKQPATRGFFEYFVTWLTFYGEELLTPRPTPKLEEHPSSALGDCFFSIFAATLRIWRPFLHPQSQDAPCCGDRDPLISTTTTTTTTTTNNNNNNNNNNNIFFIYVRANILLAGQKYKKT